MGRERVVAGWLSAIEATGRGTGPPSTVIPGIDPWDEVLRNPRIWHFAMHPIPARPERLVQGRQREYFDFFYDVLSPDPTRITAPARAAYAQAYAQDSAALSAGFNWYRTLAQDAIDNQEASRQAAVTTPVLYVRARRGAARSTSTSKDSAPAGWSTSITLCCPGPGTSPRRRNPSRSGD